ncbi:substrate-binding domain-containing protein [Streptomyces ureilyticus]|uniref:substrate-binding domain-containing protein n=1 Tax=Streptomyces ureilyticus TaxID=1775131 RepID=UPI002E284B1C|nr:substrate-binding domain-containing protein [Streptomyces ureilyticus]
MLADRTDGRDQLVYLLLRRRERLGSGGPLGPSLRGQFATTDQPLVGSVSADAALRELAERLPKVTVDRTVRGLLRVVDTPGGVRELMAHLTGLGHRRIAYLGGPPGSWMDQQRRKAARTAVADGGGELIVLDPVPPQVDAGLAAAEGLVRRDEGVSAVLVHSSYVLLGLLTGLRAAGLRVPKDISLAASDDLTVIGPRCAGTVGNTAGLTRGVRKPPPLDENAL